MSAPIVIGTRGSPLARWQADHVAAAIAALWPGCAIQQRIIVTSGDRFSGAVAPDGAGKEIWVKEIEDALLARQIRLAVHSLKDVPSRLPEGLVVAGFPARADARDALVSRAGEDLFALPPGARIGTTSLRRICQLRKRRPDLIFQPLRGNVDTRLRKVESGAVDAAILACAGLDRLGQGGRITERIAPEVLLPAVGQGILAIETRADDSEMLTLCAALSDPTTRLEATAERSLAYALGGSCRTPIAAHARVYTAAGERRHVLELTALVGDVCGHTLLQESDAIDLGEDVARVARQETTDALVTELGQRLAARLRARGADRLLAAVPG